MPVRQPPKWYVISLRPRGAHDAVRRAAARHGAGVVALSPWAIEPRDDARVRATLDEALQAPRVLFTSPAAVRAAIRLRPLAEARGSAWFAVGAGTAAALRHAGIDDVATPARMDSEGLLALPGLQDVAGTAVGLVTAPGGRGLIAPTLQSRGARIVRADVYARVPVPLAPRAVATLESLPAPGVLLLSSAGAIEAALEALPPRALATLRDCAVAAASDRLADLARAHGFSSVRRADGPGPSQLVAAAAALVPLACAR